VSLTVQVGGEPEETRVYGQLAENFEKEHSDVTIEVVEIADKDEHIARLASSFASDSPPDVFLVNFREYSQFVAQGAIEAVQPLMEERDIVLSDYYPQPIQAFTFEGTLQCMPQNVSSLVIYYNKTVFKQAGVPFPADEWSWDEFRSTAEKLSQAGVDGVGIDPEIIRIAPFVWSAGGEIVDHPEEPTRFTLDQGPAREALEFLVSLQHDGLMPTEQDLAAQDLETRFATDKLGMLLESRKVTPGFREVLDLKWDVTALPVGEEPAGILHSDAYCLSAGSSATETAADFIAFANGEQSATVAALSGRTVPSLKTVAESPAFLASGQPPANAAAFVDGIPYIRFTPVIPTWPEIEDVAKDVLTRVFYEPDYSLDQALQDLESRTAPLFEEAHG